MKIQQMQFFWFGLIIGVLILGGISLSFLISEKVKGSAIDDARNLHADFILKQSITHLTPTDFVPIDYQDKELIFSEFFTYVDTKDVLRIKVWALDGTIVYSDDKSIVGDNYSDNPNFIQAMEGKTPVEIKEPVKHENISELGYGQLMEVYVPITSSESGQVIGVIETYTILDRVNSLISDTTDIINISIGIMILTIGLVITGSFIDFKNRIIKPVLALNKSTKKVTRGKFDIKLDVKGTDELSNLGYSFNQMTNSLAKTIELEKDLVKTQEKLKAEKLTTIGTFASGLAHDLRNPLTLINNNVTLIEKRIQKGEKSVNDESARIHRAINQMSNQIEDVLNYVRTKPIKKNNVSLLESINSSLALIEIPPGIKVNLPKQDITLLADKEKLHVVFSNLILNAVQAIGTSGYINIRFLDVGDMISIEIEDSGPGVDENMIKSIFEPLVTTKLKGTGLGLASCKNLIRQHQGSIDVSLHPTKFTIKLPKTVKPEIVASIGVRK